LNETDPDAELVARVGAEEPGAVREMVARKLPRLLALATRMLGDREEANDVAQEAFVRIWKEASRWKEGPARFDTWLHRVALNLCYDRLRSGSRSGSTSGSPSSSRSGSTSGSRREPGITGDIPEAVDPAPLPEERLSERERNERIKAALAALPARQREALVLQYYQELSNVEAAQLMGISIEALESLLSRARRNLRGHLAGERDGSGTPLQKKERREESQ
jgi:RNA polymerase sigma factor (sigma-70 family)